MATATGSSIFARARTIASQTGMDANSAQIIDSLGGIRALLNNTIRSVYRTKAKDSRFLRDIVTQHVIAMTDGVGACPATVMREFLHMAQCQDVNNSLITYYDYNIDQSSGVNYGQLGYLCLQTDNLLYTEPGGSGTYTDDFTLTTPSFPTFPGSMTTAITFPSNTIIDDVVYALALAITGKEALAIV